MGQKKRPVVLIILDGWGIRKEKSFNAIAKAKTPVFDNLLKKYPNSTLKASGVDVGLPKGFIGNSEVGHLNIGAGRIVKEKIKEIDDAIRDGSFFKKKAFLNAIANCKKNNSTLHLMGLIQMEGVHAMSTHLNALLRLCKLKSFHNVVIHAFADGRDSPPGSAGKQLKVVQDGIKRYKVGRFVTLTGRYYSMDRDKRWKRTKLAYDAIMNAKNIHSTTIATALKDAYKNKESDEFIRPRIINGYSGIRDNDSIIMFNFRLDRARQLTQALIDPGFKEFKTRKPKGLKFSSMTEYYKEQGKEGALIAFPRDRLKNILGKYLSKMGKKQFRTAETEKYAHVTYFFNGQREKPFMGETRKLILSPKIATYDLMPEMSSKKVKSSCITAIKSGKFDFIAVNFANPDMVGHTGKLDAAKKAVETVDSCLKQVLISVERAYGSALIIADHGNCEEMSGRHITSHTTNKVPCILITDKKTRLRNGRLADVAPTVLELMSLNKPKEMTGTSLLK